MPNRSSAFSSALLSLITLLLIWSTVGSALAQSKMSWEQLSREIAKRPNDANLWLMRGQIQAQATEDKEAIDSFTKAIKLDPNLVEAYIGRGDAYLTYEKTQDALNDYLKAQKIFKGNSGLKGYYDLQLALANCFKTLKQYSLELPIRMNIVKHNGGADEWAGLAECQMRNKMFKETSISFQNAIKRNPHQISLHRHYGEYFVSLGDYAHGALEFGRAIDLAIAESAMDISSNYQLYELRAQCYDKLGRTALALQDRRRAQNWQESIFDLAPVQDARNK